MEDVTYLIIDGGYLSKAYEMNIWPIFGDDNRLNYSTIKSRAHARKAFYYDCLDNKQRHKEQPTDFQARVTRQKQLFKMIRDVPGMHVRLGYVAGAKRRRQKEVDVMLAVDMLNHAFHRNMTNAILIAGDRDFKPVVDALVQIGTFVHLMYEPGHCSEPLIRAADSHEAITIYKLCEWSLLDDRATFSEHFPERHMYNQDDTPMLSTAGNPTLVKHGELTEGQKPVELWVAPSGYHYMCIRQKPGRYARYHFQDRAKLERFFEKEHGKITWLSGP